MKICHIPGGWRSQLYLLPQGFIVSFELVGKYITCEWWPRDPSHVETQGLLDSYREARGDFIKNTGLNVAVIEVIEEGASNALH